MTLSAPLSTAQFWLVFALFPYKPDHISKIAFFRFFDQKFRFFDIFDDDNVITKHERKCDVQNDEGFAEVEEKQAFLSTQLM